MKERAFFLAIFCLIASVFPGLNCASKVGRACERVEDCQESAPKIFCLDGFCSEYECHAGKQQACYTGKKTKDSSGKDVVVSPCREGVRYCRPEGRWSACLGQVTPQVEICDGVDNDCDGQVDNVSDGGSGACVCSTPGASRACYSGDPETRSTAPCKEGLQYCGTNNRWGACLGQRVPEEEVCDGFDNNCDGKVDEGCPCVEGTTQLCYRGDPLLLRSGACKQGTQTCVGGAWQACDGDVLPSPELCNGLDDDCDGLIDNDCKGCQDATATPCPDGFFCCGNVCRLISTDTLAGCPCRVDTDCPSGTYKDNQKSYLCCGGRCKDTRYDVFHCGGCDQACPSQQGCRDGVCVGCDQMAKPCGSFCCPGTLACCGLSCVDTKNDPTHCGECGCPCPKGSFCREGKCVDAVTKRAFSCKPSEQFEEASSEGIHDAGAESQQEAASEKPTEEPINPPKEMDLPERPNQEVPMDGSVPESPMDGALEMPTDQTPGGDPQPQDEPQEFTQTAESIGQGTSDGSTPEYTPEEIHQPDEPWTPEPTPEEIHQPDEPWMPEPFPEEAYQPDEPWMPEPFPEEAYQPDEPWTPEPFPEEMSQPDEPWTPEPFPQDGGTGGPELGTTEMIKTLDVP